MANSEVGRRGRWWVRPGADGSVHDADLDRDSCARHARARLERELAQPSEQGRIALLREHAGLLSLTLLAIAASVAFTFLSPIMFQSFLARLATGGNAVGAGLQLFALLVGSYCAVNAVFALSFWLGLAVRQHFGARAARAMDVGSRFSAAAFVSYFGQELEKVQTSASVVPLLLLNLGITVVSSALLIRFNGALGWVAIVALVATTFATEGLARHNARLSQQLNDRTRLRAETTTRIFRTVRAVIQAGLGGNAAGIIAACRRDEMDVLRRRTTSLTWLNLLMQMVPIGLSFAVILPGLLAAGRIDVAMVFPSLLMLGTLRSAMGALPDLVDGLVTGLQVLRDTPTATAPERSEADQRLQHALAQMLPTLRGQAVHVQMRTAADTERFLHAVGGCGPVHLLADAAWVYSGTIEQNICHDHPALPARLQAALAHSCLAADLPQLKQGVDTRVEAGGANLSGGQRQRLAIARAVYDDAPILVARQAFTALDARTKHQVLHACMTEAWADRTVLLIDQDPAVLRMARYRLEVDGAQLGLQALPAQPLQDMGTDQDQVSVTTAAAAAAVAEPFPLATAEPGAHGDEPLDAKPDAAPVSLISIFGRGRLLTFVAWIALAGLFRDGLLQASQYLLVTAAGDSSVRQVAWAVALTASAALVTALMVRQVLLSVVGAMDRIFALLMQSTLGRKLNRIQQLDQFLSAAVHGQGVLDQSLAPRLVAVLSTAGFLAVTVVFVAVLVPVMIPLFAAAFGVMYALGRGYRREIAALAEAQGRISGLAMAAVTEFMDGRESLWLRGDTTRWLRQYVIPQLARHDAAMKASEYSERWFSLRMELISSLMFLCLAMWLGQGSAESPVIDGLVLVSIAAAITASGRLVKTLAFIDHDLVWLRAGLRLIEHGSTAPQAQPAPDPTQPIVLRDLRFSYGPGEKPVLAIDGISIAPGQTVAVVGRTGAGKSTLIKLLSGVLEPTGGSVRVAGLVPANLMVAEYGNVFQIIPQDPVSLPGRLRDSYFRRELDEAEIDEACVRARVDRATYDALNGPADVRVDALCAARLKLASIAASTAPVIVLDEPTAALDEQQAHDFTRTLLQLAVGRTVVMVTHNAILPNFFDWCLTLGESSQEAYAIRRSSPLPV